MKIAKHNSLSSPNFWESLKIDKEITLDIICISWYIHTLINVHVENQKLKIFKVAILVR